MRIRSLLITTLTATLVLSTALIALVVAVGYELERLAQAQASAQEVVSDTSALLVLTHEYVLHVDNHPAPQWHASHEVIVHRLQQHIADGQPIPPAALSQAHAIGNAFTHLLAIQSDGAGPSRQHRLAMQIDQLLEQTQALFDSIKRWSEDAAGKRRALERQAQMLLIGAAVIGLLSLTFLSTLLFRRVLQPLARLHAAVTAVAQGDLAVRSATDHNDELGDVSRTFDALAIDLVHRLKSREAFLQQIFDTSSVAIFLVDVHGRITHANQRTAAMFGRPLEQLIGGEYVELIHPSERDIGRAKMLALLASEIASVDLDRRYWRADGTEFWGHLTGQRLDESSGQGRGLVGVINDISAIKEHQHQLERIAHYDALTGLPNRVLLADRLHQALTHCQRRGRMLAVAYLDLDGFKEVNDRHGHDVGDELLVALAQGMATALREGDTLARIGGDEFVAVLVDLDQVHDCEPVLERLLLAASGPTLLGKLSLQVSASIGVTLYPQDASNADQLMRHADQAMYEAKQAGKNRFHLFDLDQDTAIKAQRETVDQIAQALDRREFVLHYQPKVNLKSGDITGAEALIRWQHPERGLVAPGAFLPAIEGHPISADVGEWVLRTALRQMDQWRQDGLDLPTSVNVGGLQLLHPHFVPVLAELLSMYPHVAPHNLELEILETSALQDMEQVSQVMHACSELGVRFALDDFGTGYSSLTYLKRLPAETLKIDQSFVRDMLGDPDDAAIVEGIIGLSVAFHRNVIAEGVETVGHGAMLLSLGCYCAQGYGVARPMPACDIAPWIQKWAQDERWKALRALPIANLPDYDSL